MKVDIRQQEELARQKKRIATLEAALKQERGARKDLRSKVRSERVVIQGELQDMRITLESLKAENQRMAKKLLEQQQQHEQRVSSLRFTSLVLCPIFPYLLSSYLLSSYPLLSPLLSSFSARAAATATAAPQTTADPTDDHPAHAP